MQRDAHRHSVSPFLMRILTEGAFSATNAHQCRDQGRWTCSGWGTSGVRISASCRGTGGRQQHICGDHLRICQEPAAPNGLPNLSTSHDRNLSLWADRRPGDALVYISGPVHFFGSMGWSSSPVRLFGWALGAARADSAATGQLLGLMRRCADEPTYGMIFFSISAASTPYHQSVRTCSVNRHGAGRTSWYCVRSA